VSGGLDSVLEQVRRELNLDVETERDLMEELRGHLEDAVASARARGISEDQALIEVAQRFGVEDVGRELQDAHLGQATANGIVMAALPVVCALILRWLVFAPGGTVVGWQEVLVRPAFWVVSLAALLVPLLRFPRWRYALASWAVFWALSVILIAWHSVRW